MIHMSRFRPDPARSAEFLAGLWQGAVPDDLRLHRWLYVEAEPREMLLLWEGGDSAGKWIERCIGGFGQLSTETVTDATPGLAACLERDLNGFGTWLAARGSAQADIARQLDVRRRGLEAGSYEEALAAGRAWMAEQA
jgi:hypothetical protein